MKGKCDKRNYARYKLHTQAKCNLSCDTQSVRFATDLSVLWLGNAYFLWQGLDRVSQEDWQSGRMQWFAKS